MKIFDKLNSNKANMVNVDQVRNTGLCLGCGVCESVCPSKAIKIRLDIRRGVYFPFIDSSTCIDCGLCLKICPGVEVDFQLLEKKFIDADCKEKLLGAFRYCHVGNASAEAIRYYSASGGLLTALLIFALEKKLIDGALVIGMSDANPLETISILAKSPEEIISASGSKYCPTPITQGLNQIISGDGQYAVVGLPCHLHALRKYEKINQKFRKKISMHFGIFCANNNTYLGTEYFLQQNGIKPHEVQEIRYRAEGWPGKIYVTFKNSATKIIPRGTTERKWHRKTLFSSAFHYDFMIPRCLLCPDHTAELADISFGDPWVKRYLKTERIGKSMIIVRDLSAAKLVSQAIDSGIVELEKMPVELVKKAQNYAFKQGVGARIYLRQLFGRAVPQYTGKDLRFSAADLLLGLRYLPSYFSQRRSLWPIIRFGALCSAVVTAGLTKINSYRRS